MAKLIRRGILGESRILMAHSLFFHIYEIVPE